MGSRPETGLAHSGKSTRSQPSDQWSVTRALALWLCRKEFPQRWNGKYEFQAYMCATIQLQCPMADQLGSEILLCSFLNSVYFSLRPASFAVTEVGLATLLVTSHATDVLVTELCPSLCNPMDHSPPGSSVLGILQTRITGGGLQ